MEEKHLFSKVAKIIYKNIPEEKILSRPRKHKMEAEKIATCFVTRHKTDYTGCKAKYCPQNGTEDVGVHKREQIMNTVKEEKMSDILNFEQLKTINDFINDNDFDKAKFIEYIENHEIVTKDIFLKTFRLEPKLKRKRMMASRILFSGFESDSWAITRSKFVRRIPFYFNKVDKRFSSGGRIKYYSNNMLEELEYLYYEQRIPMDKIFTYVPEQFDNMYHIIGDMYYIMEFAECSSCADEDSKKFYNSGDMDIVYNIYEMFMFWADYVRLCVKNGSRSFMPKRFIYEYNRVLIKNGLKPYIYRTAHDFKTFDGGYEFYGYFPCDEKGNVKFEWTDIKLSNPLKIECTSKKSEKSVLKIWVSKETELQRFEELKLKTKEGYRSELRWRKIYNKGKAILYEPYEIRDMIREIGVTQDKVAIELGVELRTLQTWLSGESTPKVENMIKLQKFIDKHVHWF